MGHHRRMDSWYRRGWRFRPVWHPPHTFGRLGAFVDGVFAIVATLLVLELRLPEEVPPGQLAEELGRLGPEYAAYVIGFLQIVAGWLQNRRLESWMRGVDHYATLLVLGSVSVFALTPFSTIVLAHAFASLTDLRTAVRLMILLAFAAMVLWSAVFVYARVYGLFRDDLDPDIFTLYLRLSVAVLAVPVVAWLISYVSPWVSLAMMIALYLLALLPVEGHPALQPRADLPPSHRHRPRSR
jgi:uncharacterized membrane protein